MPNHLQNETSPYLLQHVANPVDWYPWGSEALDLAREQNKPILLSIGYSACHWCHVMAQESFENPEVAAVMNEHFINIKVDREERPDIDQIYQAAHFWLNRSNGGWPLTLFLTAEQKPFFGGTYFPIKPRHGLPGFLDLLPRVAKIYHSRGDAIEQQNKKLLELMDLSLPTKPTQHNSLSPEPLQEAIKSLESNFDAKHGGFGQAPKFFHPAELAFCLQYYDVTHDTKILDMVTHTLSRMAHGGVFDQLGGGFYRYSTDDHWGIPHFEKMLYDNGLLLSLYAHAWRITGSEVFKQITAKTAKWVLREMQSSAPESGGFYSSLDADSEHEEGKFYVWDRQQIQDQLSYGEYTICAPYYGLTSLPNFEDKSWHLEINESLEQIARETSISLETAREHLDSAQLQLLALREQRIRPDCDEKILTSWNALMIKGLAAAGRIFQQQEWIDSAANAVDFVRAQLWRDNRLVATYKDGKAHLNAYLDDYAYLLDALLELMQTQFRVADLNFAIELADVLLDQFEDQELGGFFFTSHDHETLIHRPKPVQDNAMPSGNGVATTALQRLGYILGETRYLSATDKALRLFYPYLSLQPDSYASLLTALKEQIALPVVVVLRGEASTAQSWQSAVQSQFPNAIVLNIPKELVDLPDCLILNLPADEEENVVTAQVCNADSCLPAIHDLQELLHICEVQGKITFPK